MTNLETAMSEQGWAFTAAQARDAGMTTYGLSAAVRAKRWRRLGKGVYVEEARWAAMDQDARHLCLAHGRLLVLDGAWVAARKSAALAHGLPLIGRPPMRPQLVRPLGDGVGTASTKHERVVPLAAHEIDASASPRSTALPRTLVDVAREVDFRSGVVLADAVLRRGTTSDEVLESAALQSGWPGVGRVPGVVAFADGLAETAIESISRCAMRSCALPRPELQVEVWSGHRFVARVDFLWPELNLVGEADGVGKYGSSRDIYAEKVRQAELEALGFVVVRWGWDEVWRPKGGWDVTMRESIALAHGRRIDASVRLVPTTLANVLRAA